MARVHAIYRYPIKGFSGEALPSVTLAPQKTIQGDRRFGVRHANSAFDQAQPKWNKKREFLQLAHMAELAKVHTTLDPATGVMHIKADGVVLFVGNVFKDAGRRGAENVLNTLIKDARGPVQLVDAGDISLTDVELPYLSVINLTTVRALSETAGATLDPIRFRGNILIETDAPWAEFNWVGRTLTIGAAKLNVVRRIQRCVATSVNPITAARDVDIPALLQKTYGHMDFGMYVEVTSGGPVTPGDALTVS
ncbi:MAG: MOSC domain-containing protein [Rhodospirillaceae bacterium]|nr:MOSC domain-containing protein [Rhodospirillaceae bacterium]